MNGIRTVLLLGVLSGILLFAGELLGGRSGLYTAVVIAMGVNFFGYLFSDRLALSMYSAQPLTRI
jgi:heat shock protein HtpX